MINNSLLFAWISSFRLKTLPLALSAILIGNALAYWQQLFDWRIMGLTLMTAGLLQVLSNLANDYGDALSGADKPERIGPKRGIQYGLITMTQMHRALVINIILIIMSGMALLWLACQTWQQLLGFLILGGLSIIAAITYTMGKKPYGYIGLGDISVLLFFGLVSIIGSDYLQTKIFNLYLLLPAIGCGLLSVAVLNVNNLRDVDDDRVSNKRTLIVLIGVKYGLYYHCGLLSAALLCLSYFSFTYLHSLASWLFILTLPLFMQHVVHIFKYQGTSAMPPLLFQMIKLALMTNLLYAIGIIMS